MQPCQRAAIRCGGDFPTSEGSAGRPDRAELDQGHGKDQHRKSGKDHKHRDVSATARPVIGVIPVHESSRQNTRPDCDTFQQPIHKHSREQEEEVRDRGAKQPTLRA